MNPKQYTELAIRTESRPTDLKFSRGGMLATLQMLAAAASMADKLKRHIFYGDKAKLDEQKFFNDAETLVAKLNDIHEFAEHEALTKSDDGVDQGLFEPNIRVLHAGLGMFSESGELLEAIIKQIETGTLDMVNTGEEGGDQLWYQAILADETGVSIEHNMEANIAKLAKRYPDKFSEEAAVTRDLAGERAILESHLAANDQQAAKAA